MTRKLMLASSMLLGLCIPAQSACIVENVLLLTPAAVGSYGTYKTLTDQPGLCGNTFAQACAKFQHAMSQQTNPEHPSTAIRAFLINFGKYFKSHEKMAMVGSYAALLIGVILTPAGLISSLAYWYKCLNATDEEKALYEKELATALNLLGIGALSLVTGAGSMMLLVDYAQSAKIRNLALDIN